jgi:hypothetical protein
MNTTTNSYHQSSLSTDNAQDNITLIDTTALTELLKEELTLQLGSLPSNAVTVINRIVAEVERICTKSDRIQIVVKSAPHSSPWHVIVSPNVLSTIISVPSKVVWNSTATSA